MFQTDLPKLLEAPLCAASSSYSTRTGSEYVVGTFDSSYEGGAIDSLCVLVVICIIQDNSAQSATIIWKSLLDFKARNIRKVNYPII